MLTTAHKILIGSGIALGVLYAAYAGVHRDWIALAGSTVVTGTLSVYLRWFLAKSR